MTSRKHQVTPEAMSCAETGGSLVDCADSCTYYVSDSGETVMIDGGCPEACDYGCNCPEDISFSEEARVWTQAMEITSEI